MAKTRASVTLTIDGQRTSVPEGTRVIEAAKQLGVDIPHYCFHPSLSITGSCRLCLVEIEGMPKMQLACDTTVREGMVVRTNTPLVADARRGMLEFLLINHPLDCPVCDKGGECILQWYSMDYGAAQTRTIEPRIRFRKPQFDPLIELERNRCVLCSRCIRFLEEIAGEHALGVFSRGDRAYVGTFHNRPLQSIFSGMIIDHCPVGTLTARPFRFQARVWELQQVQSTCPYCASGCSVTLWMRAGRILRVTPPTRPGPEQRINFHYDYDSRAIICNQGRFGCDFVNRPDRLKRPRLRRDGRFVEVDWDEALEQAARRLRKVSDEHGRDAVGFLASSRATCEEMFLLQRLARDVVGTNNVDWRVGAADAASAKALSLAFGSAQGQLDEPDRYEIIVAINTDLLAQAPVLALKLKEAARLRFSKVFVLDYRLDGWLSRFAQGVVQYPVEHTERVLDGLERRSAVGLRPLLLRGHQAFDDLIHALRTVRAGLIVLGMDNCNGIGADGLAARVVRLVQSLGVGWHILPVVGGRNAAGAFLVGCQPDRLPGGWIDDEARRQQVSRHWGSPPPAGRGLSAPEIIEAARTGRLKALYILGTGDFHAHPWLDSILAAFARLEVLIVHDTFESPLSERADIVLPGAFFFEKEGTLVDLSGWPARLSKGWRRPFGIQDDAVVLDVLAQKLGKNFGYRDSGAVFEQMMQMVNPICPMKAGDLCAAGPGDENPIRCLNMPRAQARVQEGKFYSVCSTYLPACRLVLGTQPRTLEAMGEKRGEKRFTAELRLVWSPVLRGADALGDRSETMAPLRESPWVEMHPHDAAKTGLVDGETVVVEGENGLRACGQLRLTDRLAPGLVYVPQNWAGLHFSNPPASLPEVTVARRKAESEAPAVG